MTTPIKLFFMVVFFLLITINLYIFVSGIKMGIEVAKIEAKLDQLRRENIQYEKKLSEINSLEYTASMAAALGMNKKSSPVFLDSLKYALKP